MSKRSLIQLALLALGGCLSFGRAGMAPLSHSTLVLLPSVQVDGRGVFLDQVVRVTHKSVSPATDQSVSGREGSSTRPGLSLSALLKARLATGSAASTQQGMLSTGMPTAEDAGTTGSSHRATTTSVENTGASNVTFHVPHVCLVKAPAAGRPLLLRRSQIQHALRAKYPALAAAHWAGSDVIRITRRTRVLDATTLQRLLTAALQQQQVKERGQLQLRLTSPWTPVTLPDDPMTVELHNLPSTGVAAYFVLGFDVRTPYGRFGPWQVPVQAKVWRSIWVARSALRAGQLLSDADLARERYNMLQIHEPLADFNTPDADHELAAYVPAGSPLYAREVKLRPVVRRGQNAEACVEDGALTVSVKVRVLQDGAPGQIVRVRNLESQRELLGKVQDAHTILVTF